MARFRSRGPRIRNLGLCSNRRWEQPKASPLYQCSTFDRCLVRITGDGIQGYSERIGDIDKLQAIADGSRNDSLSDPVSGFVERSHGVLGSPTILYGWHRHQRLADAGSLIEMPKGLSEYAFVNEKLGAQGAVRFDQFLDCPRHFVD